MIVQVDEDFLDARSPTYLQPDFKNRNAANRHKAFGKPVGQRSKASAVTGGEQKSLHKMILIVLVITKRSNYLKFRGQPMRAKTSSASRRAHRRR